jgi:acetyl esterase/lipase
MRGEMMTDQLTKSAHSEVTLPASIADLRKGMEALADALPIEDSCEISQGMIGETSCLIISPADVIAERKVLYFHGGGYVSGSADTHRGFASQIAAELRAELTSVNYRLAPESPFPAAVLDGVSAYRSMVERGIDPKEIVIAGDSAGGGLTLATILKARDLGLPLPAGLVVLSPWVDLTSSGESYVALDGVDGMVSHASIEFSKRAYLGGQDPREPIASPVFADLNNMPPLLIQVGANEMLLSDATALAERAGLANVDVTLEVYADMSHVFQARYPEIQRAHQAIQRIGLWVDRLLANPRV